MINIRFDLSLKKNIYHISLNLTIFENGFRFQTRSAHEGAIDILLAHESLHVFRCDAPAILNPDFFGNFPRIEFFQSLPDELVHLFCLLGGRGLSRADGPDRFVGNHHPFYFFLAYPFQTVPLTGCPMTVKVFSSSLSFRVSPIQKIGFRPWLRAAFILLLTVSSVSPKNCLLSEWPMIT